MATAQDEPMVVEAPARDEIVPSPGPVAWSRDFTWFWSSYAVSIFGDQITLVALPLVVSGRDLLRANGRLSAAESAGNAGGPALAGALISVSVWLAFAADAITFVLSGLGVSVVRALRRPVETEEHEPRSIGFD